MYEIKCYKNLYAIVKSGQPLLTPSGQSVSTPSKKLADRLVADLAEYGEDPSNPISLVAFHYPMTDFFSVMPRAELEHSIAVGLDPRNDWTFNCPTASPEPMMKWMSLFGGYSTNAPKAKQWLSSLSLTQLCAVCVLGRVMESVNIPFLMATNLSAQDLEDYAAEVCECYPYASLEAVTKYFENFYFYFTMESEPLSSLAAAAGSTVS